MITKEEWLDWKMHPVTEAFFKACEERREETKELLVAQAGLDSTQDNFLRGFATAYAEMQEFTVEGPEDD